MTLLLVRFSSPKYTLITIMSTIYNILASLGYSLDLSNKQHMLLLGDIGTHVANVSKQLYPNNVYTKVFAGYCGNNIPLIIRLYPVIEVISYVHWEVCNFVATRNAFNMYGMCIYSRPIKEKINRRQQIQQNTT